MSGVTNENRPHGRDEAQRAALLARLEMLIGHGSMIVMDGEVWVRVPLATYLDHVPNHGLSSLIGGILNAAGVMTRAKARLDSFQFDVWNIRNSPKEVRQVDEADAEIGILGDGVQDTLDDLPAQQVDLPSGSRAVQHDFDGEAVNDLGHGGIVGGALYGRGLSACGYALHDAPPSETRPIFTATFAGVRFAVHDTKRGGVA